MAEDQQEQETAEAPDEPNGELPENLDDHARRYIERLAGETSKRRHAQREAERERDEALARVQELERKNESEDERRNREAEQRGEQRGRKAAEVEAERQIAAVRRDALEERVKARAGGRVADPDDVVLYLDVDRLAQVDPARRDQAIDKAITDLLERKPYLAPRQQTGVLISQGGRSQPPDQRPRERSWLR